MTTRRTYLTIFVGAIVALAPPILVYLQGRAELAARYAHTNKEAEAGYSTLVDSVRELRATVAAQSDSIARLQGHVEAIEAVVPRSFRMTTNPLPPIAKPRFEELPANLDAAQVMRR